MKKLESHGEQPPKHSVGNSGCHLCGMPGISGGFCFLGFVISNNSAFPPPLIKWSSSCFTSCSQPEPKKNHQYSHGIHPTAPGTLFQQGRPQNHIAETCKSPSSKNWGKININFLLIICGSHLSCMNFVIPFWLLKNRT